jgi:hypothetical protein
MILKPMMGRAPSTISARTFNAASNTKTTYAPHISVEPRIERLIEHLPALVAETKRAHTPNARQHFQSYHLRDRPCPSHIVQTRHASDCIIGTR